jgi:hypothetical protein
MCEGLAAPAVGGAMAYASDERNRDSDPGARDQGRHEYTGNEFERRAILNGG